jgi:MerR family transcriptional regulator, mercuric resistance operon regulatory protein
MATIGEASGRSGVKIETIRYYERIGIMPRPRRGSNGRRDYDEKALARLSFIRRARDLGFALDDIRALLTLADTRAPCREAHALTARHRDAVRAKIRALRRLEKTLSETANRCARAPAPCPIIEALAGTAP